MTGEAADMRNKRQLVLILAIPLVVVAISSLVFVLAQKKILNLGSSNIGTLIRPPVQMGELHPKRLDGGEFFFNRADSRWVYMVAGGKVCVDACERMLYLTRQTHTALGKKADRVQRVYLALDGAIAPELRDFIDAEHSDVTVLYVDGKQFVEQLGGLEIHPRDAQSFYVVDPLGWIMMYYRSEDTRLETLTTLGKDILKDMKRLLR